MATNLLFIVLQAGQTTANTVVEESYLSLILKGGWILYPIFFLFFVSVAVMIERWLVIQKATNKDTMWIPRVNELVKEGKSEKASAFCAGLNNSSSKVIRSGLEGMEHDTEEVQESMQVESRQQINELEQRMNYLGITAAIAPMLGFLGTIFGVIKIFYNVSVTNDLSIANISDGLYQKMICSGAGLFVGIIAYTGFYILNGRIDRVVSQMEKDSNEVLKSIRQYKKKNNEQ